MQGLALNLIKFDRCVDFVKNGMKIWHQKIKSEKKEEEGEGDWLDRYVSHYRMNVKEETVDGYTGYVI